MRFEEFNLNELTGVKQFHTLTLEQLIKKLVEIYNLKVLGTGALGTVLQGPNPNVVYKVMEQDDAYLSFVNFALANPNPHYPQFEKVKTLTTFYARYNIQPNKFTVVKLEKLLPLPEGTGAFTSELADVRGRLEAATPTYLPNGRINDENLSFYEIAETRPWVISLWHAIRAIIKSKKIKGRLDLHMYNFMQRADGTVVIIDPVADDKVFGMQSRVRSLDVHEPETRITGPVYNKKKTVKRSKYLLPK